MNSLLSQALFDRDVATLNDRLLKHRNWTLISAQYPILDVIFGHQTAKGLRLRFTCDNWNDLPPSIEALAVDGTPLQKWPEGCPGVFNSGAHPITRRPFVCMRGSREFHTHESHLVEAWDNYRDIPGMTLRGLLDQLWKAWKGGVR